MTLFAIIILAAVLIVVSVYAIKKAAPKRGVMQTAHRTPHSANPGSIPDAPGTKGDGSSALSSGNQG